MSFAEKYIKDSFERMYNSKEIEIKHVRSLENGAEDIY